MVIKMEKDAKRISKTVILLFLAVVVSAMFASSVLANSGISYEDRNVNYYMESMDENRTVKLRFYGDLKNIPYIELSDFYKTFIAYKAPRNFLTSSRIRDYHVMYTPWESAIIVNPTNDTLIVYDLSGFTYLPYYMLNSKNGEQDEFHPYLISYDTFVNVQEAEAMEIDLSKYSIDIREESDGIWFPLATLANLFSGSNNYYIMYNGTAVYAVDLARQILPENAAESDEQYYTAIKRLRPKDLVNFTYNELCFTIDTFYGYPESAAVAEKLKDEGGLDAYLENNCPEIKQLLLSQELDDYLCGMAALFYGPMYDGGHTVFNDFQWADSETYNSVVNTLWKYGKLYNQDFQAKYDARDLVKEARASLADKENVKYESIGSSYYFEYGNLALFSFDTFYNNYQQWNEYYSGERKSIPCDDDSFGQFVTAVRKASDNPKIKYFVIDISSNGGGETSPMAGMLPFIVGESKFGLKNMMNGVKFEAYFSVDSNFDGEFDTEYDNVKADLKFAIMTSRTSFSCANLMASIMKDNGIPVIGEQSGGGACAIEANPTPEGFVFYLSSREKLVNSKGESIDMGIPIDIPLPVSGTGDEHDYSAFYDLQLLSKLLSEYYGDEEPDEPAETDSPEEYDLPETPVFSDVPENAWYKEAVDWTCSEGYMNGVAQGIFSPDSNPTRAMLVTILWRLEGKPATETADLPFSDITHDSWYEEAVAWAWKNQIVNGVSTSSFAPGLALTREQIATVLFRYMEYKGADTSVSGNDNENFTDAESISSWAYKPLSWAVENGVITGTRKDLLSPKSYSTRAQLAMILYRLFGEKQD